MSKLLNYKDTVDLINTGKLLIISAPTEILMDLPKGNYIAASCYYFIVDGIGKEYNDKCFVNEISEDIIKHYHITTYDDRTIKNINKNIPLNGFGYVLIPYGSKCHFEFALNGANYEDFAVKNLYGFITGTRKVDIGKKKAIVKDGSSNTIIDDYAAVINVELKDEYYTYIDIINPFEPIKDTEIEFLTNSFEIKDALINGENINFAQYIRENNIDIRYPLIYDNFGAKVNVSLFEVKDNKVLLSSPVFKGITYYRSKPTNYVEVLYNMKIAEKPTISCNCFLNYHYMNLEGRKLNETISGPSTFGEIAYRLLNQTIVNLYIKHR